MVEYLSFADGMENVAAIYNGRRLLGNHYWNSLVEEFLFGYEGRYAIDLVEIIYIYLVVIILIQMMVVMLYG